MGVEEEKVNSTGNKPHWKVKGHMLMQLVDDTLRDLEEMGILANVNQIICLLYRFDILICLSRD